MYTSKTQRTVKWIFILTDLIYSHANDDNRYVLGEGTFQQIADSKIQFLHLQKLIHNGVCYIMLYFS